MIDNSEGYIGLYRCLLDKPIWMQSTPEQKVILITLLLMVNYKENEWAWKGKKYICKPGQKITSLESIQEKCGKGISVRNIRTALKRFEKLEFLTNESTKEGRLVTVLNWHFYQVELLKSTNELTVDRQRGDKGVTTNKKDKKDNKDNKVLKDIYADFVTLSSEEYQKLLDQFGEQDTKDRIEKLSLYKGSTGKKYASDYLTILNWAKKDKDKPQQKYPQQKPINMQNTQQRKYNKEDIDKMYDDV